MLFEEESYVADYLCVLLDQDTDNDTISLRQSGLAKKIVEALHLYDDTSPVETSTDSFLHLDDDGETAHASYNYVSIVGICDYLESCFCSDITFFVSQVLHYTFCSTKQSHELILEQIGQHFKKLLRKVVF